MKTWDECRNESDLSVRVKFSKNVTTYTVQKRCSPAPATQPRAYLRDDLRVIRDVTCLGSDDASSDDSSSLDSSRIAPKCWRAWAVDNSCGMSSPSSVRHSGQGTPQLKQTGMSLCTYQWFAPGWGGRATHGKFDISGFQMSISPPLGLPCKSNSHPWGPQTFIVS